MAAFMLDPNFKRSVIPTGVHADRGTIWLPALNKPLDTRFTNSLLIFLENPKAPVHIAPVAVDKVRHLHNVVTCWRIVWR
ncbi:MAG: hypothetical protein IPP49_20115 [Saprospiraceae bacterium]|nr:hypothetical protein [Saprospiraceae bacterium]